MILLLLLIVFTNLTILAVLWRVERLEARVGRLEMDLRPPWEKHQDRCKGLGDD